MSTREEQFLRVYTSERFEDQLVFYEGRIRDFTVAGRQVAILAAIAFGLSSAVAVLAGLDLRGKAVIAVCAVALPALSTALGAFDALYGFERHAKLYGDAARSLAAIESPGADPDSIRTYVESVESVLRTEQGQWGQLAADLATAPGGRAPGS